MRRLSSIISLLAVLAMSPVVVRSAIAAEQPCGVTERDCAPGPVAAGDVGSGGVVTTGVQFPGVSDDSTLGKATRANASSCHRAPRSHHPQ